MPPKKKMKPDDEVEEIEEEEEEGPALEYGPLTYDEFERRFRLRTEPRELCYGPLTRNESLVVDLRNFLSRYNEQEDTISHLQLDLAQRETVIASQQEAFDTLQAAAEHANQALLAGSLRDAHQALGEALVLSQEQFHRRELAQEQENNNQGNNNTSGKNDQNN